MTATRNDQELFDRLHAMVDAPYPGKNEKSPMQRRLRELLFDRPSPSGRLQTGPSGLAWRAAAGGFGVDVLSSGRLVASMGLQRFKAVVLVGLDLLASRLNAAGEAPGGRTRVEALAMCEDGLVRVTGHTGSFVDVPLAEVDDVVLGLARMAEAARRTRDAMRLPAGSAPLPESLSCVPNPSEERAVAEQSSITFRVEKKLSDETKDGALYTLWLSVESTVKAQLNDDRGSLASAGHRSLPVTKEAFDRARIGDRLVLAVRREYGSPREHLEPL